LLSRTIAEAKAGHRLTATTFSLLYAADLADRLEHEIIPALRAGFVVLADRYTYTAFARNALMGAERSWTRDLFGYALVPDLVLYLQAPTEVLLRRLRARHTDPELAAFKPDPDYLRELNEAYHHFFFHYNTSPLLFVETSQLDVDASDEALDDLLKQIRSAGPGTRYYVPRTRP